MAQPESEPRTPTPQERPRDCRKSLKTNFLQEWRMKTIVSQTEYTSWSEPSQVSFKPALEIFENIKKQFTHQNHRKHCFFINIKMIDTME